MNNPYFDLIRAVWRYGKAWRRSIVVYYLAYILAQACWSLSPYAFGRTINILQHFSPGQLNQVILWLSISVFVLLLFWIFHGPARIMERQVALKIQQSFRLRLYEKISQLPLKWHQDNHSGSIISRINRASIALHRFAENQYDYVETIIKFVTSIAFLLWISLPVGLLSLATCLLVALIVILFDRVLIPLYNIENEIDNRVSAGFFDYVSNMTTIITLRLGELTRTNLSQRMQAVWPHFKREVNVNEVKWFSTGMLLAILQAVILMGYIIIHLKDSGAIMIGTVVMIFRYQSELSEVFYSLSSHYSELVRMDADVKGLKPILQDIERLAQPPRAVMLARKWHEFSIEKLQFHHAGSMKQSNMFSKFALTIKRGEKIALIGPSGVGKSTLLNLLRGLYVPNHVQLRIDDTEFQSLKPLQAITTLIPQDPEIFENTIEFNITMDVAHTDVELQQAIKLAGFDKVLLNMPQGLATDIREKGMNMSVGQKQRLALARGLFAARFSSFILMDEPTSSVDLATEKEILAGVIQAYPDAAMMVSLHRLHLLPIFDRIIMLKHGEIVASGPAVELLEQPGPVRDLWLAYQNK